MTNEELNKRSQVLDSIMYRIAGATVDNIKVKVKELILKNKELKAINDHLKKDILELRKAKGEEPC